MKEDEIPHEPGGFDDEGHNFTDEAKQKQLNRLEELGMCEAVLVEQSRGRQCVTPTG